MNFEAAIFDNKVRQHYVARSSSAVSAILKCFQAAVEGYLGDSPEKLLSGQIEMIQAKIKAAVAADDFESAKALEQQVEAIQSAKIDPKEIIRGIDTHTVYSMFRMVEVDDTYLGDPRAIKDQDIRELMVIAIWDLRSQLMFSANADDAPFWYNPDGTISPVGYIRPVI